MGVTTGIVGFPDLNNAGQEGPHLLRSREADLKQRINGQLTLRYEASGLTPMRRSTANSRTALRRLRTHPVLLGQQRLAGVEHYRV